MSDTNGEGEKDVIQTEKRHSSDIIIEAEKMRNDGIKNTVKKGGSCFVYFFERWFLLYLLICLFFLSFFVFFFPSPNNLFCC